MRILRFTTIAIATLLNLAALRADEIRKISDLDLMLVAIKPGTFLMGAPTNESEISGERPQTKVSLSKPFWLGRTEVTQAQWMAVMGENPSRLRGDLLPVHDITWDEAMAFCRKLTERERAANRLPEGYVYLLPTEAQWEYACRAGTEGPYAGELDEFGWHKGNSGNRLQAVGKKAPNAWGFHDMHGNVWEWCLDWYTRYPGGEVIDHVVNTTTVGHVVRGGSWRDPAGSSRSAFRFSARPPHRDPLTGFRVALSPLAYLPQ